MDLMELNDYDAEKTSSWKSLWWLCCLWYT